jgi:hypothetical protein
MEQPVPSAAIQRLSEKVATILATAETAGLVMLEAQMPAYTLVVAVVMLP